MILFLVLFIALNNLCDSSADPVRNYKYLEISCHSNPMVASNDGFCKSRQSIGDIKSIKEHMLLLFYYMSVSPQPINPPHRGTLLYKVYNSCTNKTAMHTFTF
jgi:hypothetical protein